MEERNELKIWVKAKSPYMRTYTDLELEQHEELISLKESMISLNEIEDIASSFDVIRDNAKIIAQNISNGVVSKVDFEELLFVIDDLATLKDMVIKTTHTQ